MAEINWAIAGPILSGLAALAVAILTIIKAIGIAPQEARSNDANTAKSYAEAAEKAAEQCSKLYDQLKESRAIIEKLQAESIKRKEATERRDETIARLTEQVNQLTAEANDLRAKSDKQAREIVQLKKENAELRARINGD